MNLDRLEEVARLSLPSGHAVCISPEDTLALIAVCRAAKAVEQTSGAGISELSRLSEALAAL